MSSNAEELSMGFNANAAQDKTNDTGQHLGNNHSQLQDNASGATDLGCLSEELVDMPFELMDGINIFHSTQKMTLERFNAPEIQGPVGKAEVFDQQTCSDIHGTEKNFFDEEFGAFLREQLTFHTPSEQSVCVNEAQAFAQQAFNEKHGAGHQIINSQSYEQQDIHTPPRQSDSIDDINATSQPPMRRREKMPLAPSPTLSSPLSVKNLPSLHSEADNPSTPSKISWSDHELHKNNHPMDPNGPIFVPVASPQQAVQSSATKNAIIDVHSSQPQQNMMLQQQVQRIIQQREQQLFFVDQQNQKKIAQQQKWQSPFVQQLFVQQSPILAHLPFVQAPEQPQAHRQQPTEPQQMYQRKKTSQQQMDLQGEMLRQQSPYGQQQYLGQQQGQGQCLKAVQNSQFHGHWQQQGQQRFQGRHQIQGYQKQGKQQQTIRNQQFQGYQQQQGNDQFQEQHQGRSEHGEPLQQPQQILNPQNAHQPQGFPQNQQHACATHANVQAMQAEILHLRAELSRQKDKTSPSRDEPTPQPTALTSNPKTPLSTPTRKRTRTSIVCSSTTNTPTKRTRTTAPKLTTPKKAPAPPKPRAPRTRTRAPAPKPSAPTSPVLPPRASMTDLMKADFTKMNTEDKARLLLPLFRNEDPVKVEQRGESYGATRQQQAWVDVQRKAAEILAEAEEVKRSEL